MKKTYILDFGVNRPFKICMMNIIFSNLKIPLLCDDIDKVQYFH